MKSLLDAMARRADEAPTALAVCQGERQWDQRTLWQAVCQQAQWLQHQLRSSSSGRPIALAADNSIEWIVADLACLLAGVPCVPVPGFFTDAQRQHLLRDSGCLALWRPDHTAPDWQWLDYPAVNLPEGCCKVTYTSGSTGEPKGVCLAAEALQRTVLALAERLQGLTVRRHLCTMPLAVLLENLAGVYLPLWLGTPIELVPLATLGLADLQRPDPRQFLSTLAGSTADSLILLPATLGWLLQGVSSGMLSAQRWQLLAVGGGKTSQQMLHQAQQLGLPVFEGYGLSEVGSVAALNGPGLNRMGSVGKPLSHVEIRLAADGEVLIRGNTMLGYLGESSPGSPWLATGDLGAWDSQGYLTILGRKKSTLVTALGRNVNPEWIEAELLARPGVLQAFVYGDEQQGIRALLFAPGLQSPEALAALLAQCNAQLPGYARLEGATVIDTPFSHQQGELTSNGRLRRHVIARQRLPQQEQV